MCLAVISVISSTGSCHLCEFDDLVFAASGFSETSLLRDKPVAIFGHGVESVSNHTFQRFDHT